MNREREKARTKGEILLEGVSAMAAETIERELAISPEVARLVADEITTRFSSVYGGHFYYVPKGRIFRTSALYRQIWEEFNGSNIDAIADKHKMTVPHAYRVIARERARDRAERQGTLPLPPEAPGPGAAS